MITAGIDVGSLTAKAVIFGDGKILSHSLIPTGADSVKTARKAMDEALNKIGLLLNDIRYIVSTGYGRVLVPFANKNITEISCHAKGAVWFFPNARTILDMGGQDCKTIRCNEEGRVINFALNEKCAAGTGRFFDVIAKALELPLSSIGGLSLQAAEKPPAISNVCVIFAKSEVLRLLRKGVHKEDILAGLFDALSSRIYGLIGKVGVESDFIISGGVAKNIGIVKRLEEKVGLRASISFEPQIVGAMGAAIFAREILEKSLRSAKTA